MALEIRHLRALCAIADAGSLSRGAASLGMTQPSVTALVQRVEALVGGQLFVRSHSGVTPTPAGRRLLRRARQVLLEYDGLVEEVRAGSRQGPVRLGASHMDCLTTLVQRLDAALPDADVVLQVETSSTDLAQALASGHLDAAIIAMCDDQEVAIAAHLAHRVLLPWVPVFVALSAEHPLAAEPEIDRAALADEAWIGPPGPEDGSLASLRAAADRAGFSPRIRFEFPHGGGRQLIAAGQAVQLVEPTAPEFPGMAVRPLKGAPMRMRIVLAWHRERMGWEQVQTIHREAAAAYAQHAMSSPVFSRWWRGHAEFQLPAI